MKTNTLDHTALGAALALLEELRAEVVDACGDSACEVCRPGFELAA